MEEAGRQPFPHQRAASGMGRLDRALSCFFSKEVALHCDRDHDRGVALKLEPLSLKSQDRPSRTESRLISGFGHIRQARPFLALLGPQSLG